MINLFYALSSLQLLYMRTTPNGLIWIISCCKWLFLVCCVFISLQTLRLWDFLKFLFRKCVLTLFSYRSSQILPTHPISCLFFLVSLENTNSPAQNTWKGSWCRGGWYSSNELLGFCYSRNNSGNAKQQMSTTYYAFSKSTEV